jgi:hypothetical protein
MRWHWQAVVAALLAFLAVEGQPVAASYATSGSAGAAWHAAHQFQSSIALPARVEAAPAAEAAEDATADVRPDFLVAFAHLDDVLVGQPFSYTLQVRNDGSGSGAVSVSTILPPEVTNVRVNAPGFVCTRRFSASGAQAGTLVSCLRNDLESGGAADVTIEANAPVAPGAFHLTAKAGPRDDATELDAANNEADAMVQVHA